MKTIKIDNSGTKEYRENGHYHREDGPAVIFKNGDKIWMFNGKPHRIDGPAIIYDIDGYRCWYLNGKEFTEHEWYNQPETKAYRNEQERIKKLEII